MKVTGLPDVRPATADVAVGTFDGVHLGHRRVIAGSDTVLTFEPHPVSVVAPQAAPKLLTELERKAELLEPIGVHELVVIPFDRAFAARSAQEFIDDVLVGALGAAARRGGGELPLRPPRAGRRRAAARPTAASTSTSSRCSRSTARSCPPATSAASCSAARSSTPTACSDAPFTIAGTVVHGDKRGRGLGFPTANLVPARGLRRARTRRLCVPRRARRRHQRPGGRQRRRAAAVRDRARRAGRGAT